MRPPYALLVAIAVQSAAAQQPVHIARITAPITIDGRVDEPAWNSVAPLPLTTYLPVAGKHPQDSSEVRLAYDDKYLYASARFFVTDSSEIQSTSLGRDQLGPDDRFRLMLDTYNDNRTGVGFLVTESGARSDYDVTDDGGHLSNDWNTFWDAATSRNGHGWYAEMRIPWSSLRFTVIDGRVTMGVIALRVSVKKNEWSTYPALSPAKSNALWRSSVAQKLVFDGLQRHSPAYITPYALGGVGRTATLAADKSAFGYDTEHKTEFGGDLKYGLTDNLTLDLTANTDFAQVEADNQQVNLTRFSLFFPEKRQFFLERAGSFDFTTSQVGDGARLFYTRRIGLAPDGTPLRIYGGARVVGAAGPIDLGVMELQVRDPLGGSENIGVMRARHRVINDGSFVGALLTSRFDASHHNVVYGTDASIRPFGNEYITAQWAQSFDDVTGSGWKASQARLGWARRSSQGLIYAINAKWSGAAFNPALGFEPRSDYALGSLELDYNWISKKGYSLQPSLFTYGYMRNQDGKLDSGELYPYVNFGFPSGLNGWVAWRGHDEDITAPFNLSATATVGVGRHRYQQGEFYLVSPTAARFGYTLLADIGGFYDGRQRFVDFTPTWSISPHLTVGGEYQYNRISFPTRQQYLNADVARLKVLIAVNNKLSAETFIQYNNAGRLGVGNARLRYQFSEGNDLYLVYNDQVNADRERLLPSLPELPLSQARTFLVKYTYTFIT